MYSEIPTLHRFRTDAGLATGGHRDPRLARRFTPASPGRTPARSRFTLAPHRGQPARRGFTLAQHRDPGLSPAVLETLCDLVGRYHQSEQWKVLKRLDYLGQMYIAGRFWLREESPHHRSRVAVRALFEVCKEKLCEIYGCGEDTLKDELKAWFGKDLWQDPDKPGENIREHELELYPERDETAKYRLEFRNGRAYMLDWFRHPEVPKLIPADSRHLPSTVITPGFAGYVMVLGNRILMAKHRHEDEEEGLFAHSFYKQGRPIMCAGEIAIVDGRVLCVSNASGHYRPAPEKVIHTVRCLRLNGVDLRGVAVNLRTDEDSNYYEAQAFFMNDGNLTGLVPFDSEREKQLLLSIPGYVGSLRAKHLEWTGERLTDEQLLQLYFG